MLRALIAMHPHADHIGGIEDVIDGFEIGEMIMPDMYIPRGLLKICYLRLRGKSSFGILGIV